MAKKRRLIFWSGGLDSSYLVYKSLWEGYEVHAVYVEIGNNAMKVERERAAIKKMLVHFEPMGLVYQEQFISATIDNLFDYVPNEEHELTGPGFKQFPIFVLGLFMAAGHFDEIAMGYIMNDDFISYVNDATALFDKIKAFTHGRDTKLVFPLMKLDKAWILVKTPAWIKNMMTTCESPLHIDFCGNCITCGKLKLADGDLFNRRQAECMNESDEKEVEKEKPMLLPIKKKRKTKGHGA